MTNTGNTGNVIDISTDIMMCVLELLDPKVLTQSKLI